MEHKSQIKVLEASWLYDNIVPNTIQIYKLNYDYFYHQDEGYNDENEKPNLNEFGEQFIVMKNSPDFENKIGFPFHTSLDLEEAKKYVETILDQKLNWETKS